MRKKLIYTILSAIMYIGALVNLKAQINDFNLSDYKLTDYKRQGVDIDFRLLGNSYTSKILGQQDYSSKNMFFSNNLRSNYFRIFNNRKYQGNNNANLSFGNYSSKNATDTTSKSKDVNYSMQTNVSSSYRFFNPKEYFVLLSFSCNLDMITSQRNYYLYQTGDWQESDNEHNTSKNLTSSGNIGIGKGRIEPVEDARQAIYILDELKKSNRLKREPSNDEILAFSKRISELKNERVLDSRLKKIEELKQIDSFLVDGDFVEKYDITYFSALNDIWDFGGLVQRNSGFSIQISYNPNFNYRKSIVKKMLPSVEETTNEVNIFNNCLIFSLDWSRPFKQKLQSNLYYSISYFNDNTKYYLNKDISNGIRSIVGYSFGYYPNTRTSLNFGLRLAGSKSWDIQKIENVDYIYSETYSYSIYPSFSLNYYFSPNLKLNCTYNTNAAANNNLYYSKLESKSISNYIEVSLLYSIF